MKLVAKNNNDFIYPVVSLSQDYVIYQISKGTFRSEYVGEGVYPEGTTSDDVRKKVNGTFGGRFEYFGGGRFKFIAYTD